MMTKDTYQMMKLHVMLLEFKTSDYIFNDGKTMVFRNILMMLVRNVHGMLYRYVLIKIFGNV